MKQNRLTEEQIVRAFKDLEADGNWGSLWVA